MDRLDTLLAHAARVVDEHLEVLEAPRVDLSRVVVLNVEHDGRVDTIAGSPATVADKLDAFTAPIVLNVSGTIRETARPLAVAIVRAPGGVLRSRAQGLVVRQVA